MLASGVVSSYPPLFQVVAVDFHDSSSYWLVKTAHDEPLEQRLGQVVCSSVSLGHGTAASATHAFLLAGPATHASLLAGRA